MRRFEKLFIPCTIIPFILIANFYLGDISSLSNLAASWSIGINVASADDHDGDDHHGDDHDGDGYNACSDHDEHSTSCDCDDEDAAIHPGAVELCNDKDDNCDGHKDEGLTRATTCGTGACAATGTEKCDDGEWKEENECTPGDPASETCNGIDDDCDGSIDENLSQESTCGTGACAATGNKSCNNGEWTDDTCTPGEASSESCNGIDDDCDGTVDEGFSEVSETCNNIDDNCNGQIDENLSQDTTCGVGACASTGVKVCTAGSWGGDTCAPGTPTTETCNGIDDDCDGSVDNGLTSESTTCGVGVCANTGNKTCVSGSWQDSCTPNAPSGISETICNGADDDCDGQIDEDSDCQTCGTNTTCPQRLNSRGHNTSTTGIKYEVSQ